jgi:hypothetical protein
MENAVKDPPAEIAKDSSTDSKPSSHLDAGPGANQNATNKSAEGSGKDSNPNKNSTQDANRSSTDSSAGKPTASTNADGSADKHGSEEPKLDPKLQELIEAKIDARVKALLELHLEPLLAVNRQLALFLGEQLENMIELRQSVCAVERLIEADPRRKGKYAAMLEQVKSEGAGVKDPHWINRTRGMLSRLERTGTLGPKSDGPTQA